MNREAYDEWLADTCENCGGTDFYQGQCLYCFENRDGQEAEEEESAHEEHHSPDTED